MTKPRYAARCLTRLCACGCGLEFTPTAGFNAYRQKYVNPEHHKAFKERERERLRLARNRFIDEDADSRATRKVVADHVSCSCPDHHGVPVGLPKQLFYRWEVEVLRYGRRRKRERCSTWCKMCLKRYIRTHDGAADHGQSPTADDMARLDLYRDEHPNVPELSGSEMYETLARKYA